MQPRYGLAGYLAGSTTARVADEMSATGLLLIAMATSVPASVPALLVACLTGSAALGGPALGALLDRSVRPGRFLAGCLLLYAVGLAVLSASLGHLAPVWLCGTAFVAGLLGPAISGGWSSQLGRLLTGERLRRATTLDATTFSLAGLLGPGAAGAIAVVWGPSEGIAVLVALLLVAAVLSVRLPRRGRAEGEAPGRVLTDIRLGVSAIVRVPGLRAATGASCLAFVGVGLYGVLAPRIGVDRLGGAGQGALLLAVGAAGAMVASLALTRWPVPWAAHRTLGAATLVVGAGFAVSAIPTAPAAVVGAAVIGLGEGPALFALMAIRHQDAPPQLRAQVFTTGASLKITASSAGAALGGLLVGIPIAVPLLLACVTQLVAVAALTPSLRTTDAVPA